MVRSLSDSPLTENEKLHAKLVLQTVAGDRHAKVMLSDAKLDGLVPSAILEWHKLLLRYERNSREDFHRLVHLSSRYDVEAVHQYRY